ncbi:MAG: preprotein translocase subunit YajC [Taibaiella sp.]|nr:preprotein translocase subunit YajC [Taibaiella sp.]
MIVIMYFFMIRPQQKKAKDAKKFQESINTSEKVVTTSGIHGRVVRNKRRRDRSNRNRQECGNPLSSVLLSLWS